MPDAITRVNRTLSRAVSTFQKAHDAVVAAEQLAAAEVDALDVQIAELHAHRSNVCNTQASAAELRHKLAEFTLA